MNEFIKSLRIPCYDETVNKKDKQKLRDKNK